jgi:taspase (threonine aspartase 1)
LMRAERIDGDSWIFRPSASLAEVERELDMYYSEAGSAEASRIKHERTMLLSMLHSGHPITPLSPAPSDSRESNLASLRSPIASLNDRMRPGSGTTTPESEAYLDPVGPPGMLENTARNPFANSTQQIPSTASLLRIVNSDGAAEGGAHMNEIGFHRKHDSDFHFEEQLKDDLSMTGTDTVSGREPLEQSRRAGDTRQAFTRSSIDVTETCSFSRDEEHTIPDREDHITDTIGAIAVDRHGNIACAASSGGISMKHRGRVGPAALIGVGAFVVPVNTNDPDRTSVAAVTSGTGEHMATTFAAHAAAQRIYHPRRPRNVRRSSATPSGHSSRASSGPASPISDDVEIESWPSSSSLRSTGSSPAHPTSFEEPCDEPEALQAFITSDFLGHPSVRHSHSAGAIGALVVKKTLDGIWLYFAHNTDSFALASMHGEEPRPVCTMSRKSNDRAASGNAGLAHGGRGMRFGRSSGGRTR